MQPTTSPTARAHVNERAMQTRPTERPHPSGQGQVAKARDGSHAARRSVRPRTAPRPRLPGMTTRCGLLLADAVTWLSVLALLLPLDQRLRHRGVLPVPPGGRHAT